jgi:hypothetical protein
MIPELDTDGNLPPGIHRATWMEIVTRYATSTHRRDLLDGLLDALRSLKSAGCSTAYLDGSFVTAKDKPEDFDVCWESADVVFDRLDPSYRTSATNALHRRHATAGSSIPPSGRCKLMAQPVSTSSNTTTSPTNPRGSSPST